MLVGLDVGGTKTAGIALDKAGVDVSRHAYDTPRDYDGMLSAITETVAELDRSKASHVVGIGLPGVLTHKDRSVHRSVNLSYLEHRPLADDLDKKLGCNIILTNGANCFALSETAMQREPMLCFVRFLALVWVAALSSPCVPKRTPVTPSLVTSIASLARDHASA